MGHWQPAVDRLMHTVTGVLDQQPIDEGRLRQWRRIDNMPPVLVTESGWMVDGRHRLIVARERGEELWGQVVARVGEHWVATGNVVRVR